MLFRRSLFFHYLKPYTGRLLLNVFIRILSALFTILLLVSVAPFLSLLFDTASIGATSGGSAPGMEIIENWTRLSIETYGKQKTLLFVVLFLTSAYFLKNFFAYLGLYLFIPIRNKIVAQLRNDIYRKFLILPMSYYAREQKGDLISRISHNAQDIDNQMLNQIQQILVDVITLAALVIALFLISTPLSLFVLIIIPLTGGITSLLSRVLKRKSKELRNSTGRISSQITETLEGIKTLRSYNTCDYAVKKFDDENELFYKLNSKVEQRLSLSSPLNEVLGMAAVAAILIMGGYLIVSKQSLRPEAFITYLLTMVQILPSSKNIITAVFTWQSGKGSLARIKEILYAEEVIVEKEDALSVSSFKKEILFDKVCFSYQEKQTLKNIDLRIEKGKFVAFVGPSGGGKSTLLNLIPRFYDPVSGRIRIDGIDLADYKIDELRSLSSLVSQDTILFNDTIRNNIALGNPSATEEDIIEAAKMAEAHEFILATEKGYDTVIGDSGAKLSGGQRQRISIARALVKKAPILLFDEATSALDSETEIRIMDAVRKSAKENCQTIISVAHRLSSVARADEIIVVYEGEIIGRGTHQELFAQNELYRKLCLMQDSEKKEREAVRTKTPPETENIRDANHNSQDKGKTEPTASSDTPSCTSR